MKRKEDRRIQRTKQALREALIDLILDRGYEDIGVQDIVDRANIGRSTFYTHYSTKDAAFSDSFMVLETSLLAALKHENADPALDDGYGLKYSGLLFAHVDGHRHLYRALTGQRGGMLATKHIQKILFGLVHRDFEERTGGTNLSKTERDAAAHYVVGAIIGVMTWWLDSKTQWSANEVNEFLTSMIAPGLRKIFADKN